MAVVERQQTVGESAPSSHASIAVDWVSTKSDRNVSLHVKTLGQGSSRLRGKEDPRSIGLRVAHEREGCPEIIVLVADVRGDSTGLSEEAREPARMMSS